MKIVALILLLIFTLSCSPSRISAQTAKLDQSFEKLKLTQEQDSLLIEQTQTFPEETQLSIALIKGGQIQFHGVKRTNNSLDDVENYNSVFEIGSITKVFTATILANLVLDKTVSLDDSVNPYFDFPFKDNQQITFEELANHTSGLRNMPSNFPIDLSNPDPIEGLDDAVIKEYLSEKLVLSHKFYTKYNYSNLGAGLLATTLSEVTGADFATLLESKVFSKYGMKRSFIGEDGKKPYLVEGRNSDGKPTANWTLNALEGAGAIISSVEDLAKFATAQFDESNMELALTRQKTYWISPISEVGLGWHMKKKLFRNKWYWHNGGTGGYTSCIVIDPKKQNGVIVLTNLSTFRDDSVNVDNICFGLMKTL